MKELIKKMIGINTNETARHRWLVNTLAALPAGQRILDAGAGELRNKLLCSHLYYVSQDFCQYDGTGDSEGLQTGTWDTSKIDIICDIVNIPEQDASFDVILCSEVFEHLPTPLKALDEFSRLLKPGGKLIVTAPFASLVHFAPYHFATGFSRYWYEHHFPLRGLKIEELESNGDWFDYVRQEILRLPAAARRYRDWCWPLACFVAIFGWIYFFLRGKSKKAADVACFGWHCIATKNHEVGGCSSQKK